MTDEKEKSSSPAAETPPAAATETGETQDKKSYKSPTIKRHGNLRLMTQLE